MVEKVQDSASVLYNDFVARDNQALRREEAVGQLQSSVLRETSESPKDLLDQTLQLVSSGSNLQTAEKTARQQIEKGYLDIRV